MTMVVIVSSVMLLGTMPHLYKNKNFNLIVPTSDAFDDEGNNYYNYSFAI